MLAVVATAWGVLGLAMRNVPPRASASIALWAALFRCIGFIAPPVMEDDHYRFLWDGYQFARTGNPYAEAPQARFGDETIAPPFQEILDHINHPDVPTIYGPLCQWAFYFSYLLASAQLWPWKLILLAAEAATLAILWRTLSVRGRLLLAWCPLAVFETGFNAHPDALAIAMIVAAWKFGQSGNTVVAAGVFTGLAITTKAFALWLAPFLLFRLPLRARLAAVIAVVCLYAPFWFRGSLADLAGLTAMATEWEFNSSVFALLAAVSTPTSARAICALLFGAIWICLFARWAKAGDRSELPPGEWFYGSFLLLSATVNAWYCLWLLPFVAARTSAVGISALAAVSLSYITGLNLGSPSVGIYEHPFWVRPLEYGLIGLITWWSATKEIPRP
ncbi:MAG: hypothetical protein L0Z53_19350 [Acidobacteriales bacterium]|nr:hypothetical protein [Terriglobales bacterium]